jgi:outer membrane protein OmpA-like peptidoglycan-associated protein
MRSSEQKSSKRKGGITMQAITAKRVLMFVIAMFSMSLIVGCYNMEMGPKDRQGGVNKPAFLYYHKPLPEAARALNDARMAGKDRECPAEFNAAKDMVDKAYEVYMACHTQEAIAMAQEAIVKINALCPAKPEPVAEEKAVIMAAEPKVEEKVMVAAGEPKVIVLAFEDVHFGFDKSTLTPLAKTLLKKNVQLLKDNPGTKVRIAGYTSASGTEAYNQKLSERRANAVKKYLINEGIITRDRLSTIGYGESNPAVYEARPKDLYSKAAKANMRVLFEIIVR